MRSLAFFLLCFCLPYWVLAQTDLSTMETSKMDAQQSTVPGRILWDVHHGILPPNHPSTENSTFLALMETRGFQYDISYTSVLDKALDEYQILIISISTSWNSTYSEAEVERIDSWVRQGGSLVLLSDHGSFDIPLENIEPIAHRFGIDLLEAFVDPPYGKINIFADHPLFEGMSILRLGLAGAVEVQPPMSVSAWAPDGEAVVAQGQFGNGVVVVISDSDLFDFDFLPSYDNERFAENLLDYLIAARVPVLSEGFLLLLVALMALVAGSISRRRFRH